MSDSHLSEGRAESGGADVIGFLNDCTDQIFANVLDPHSDLFESNATILGESHPPLRAIIEQVQIQQQELTSSLAAGLDFILGREDYANDQIESALAHYQRSLSFWPHALTSFEQNLFADPSVIPPANSLERLGAILFHVGLSYYRRSQLDSSNQQRHNQDAKTYLKQCLDIFELAQRRDLVAKFIPKLCIVLQQLKAWEELQTQAQKALDLHISYGSHHDIAQDYGFLAEAAMHQSQWSHANQLAELALEIQNQSLRDPLQSLSDENPYLLLLAESKHELKVWQATVNRLEDALNQTNPYEETKTYLQILKALHQLYFEQDYYGSATHIKEKRFQTEYQLGLRSFVGFRPLKQQFKPQESSGQVAPEMIASGRLNEINELVERIESPDHKLIVLHGESGVGKSSLINAGIIPTLLQKQATYPEVSVPITLRIYTDWLREPNPETWNLGTVLNRLRKNSENHLSTVLIFDQFEEFFLICTEPNQRLPFYQFLHDCLSLKWISVILSMRTDFLHYLLECDRTSRLEAVIGYEVLSKQVLYELRNFSADQAKAFIKHQTQHKPTQFDEELINHWIEDLGTRLGEIRPIELQITGSQLQTDGITTLEQYQQFCDHPQLNLIARFLDEALADCGFKNERVALLVLYSLTQENGIRPLKTRAELIADLDMTSPEKIDMVLEVFVENGLVLLLPDIPEDRYQLAHDYLVSLIRQQKGERLIAELELERNKAQRKLMQEKPDSFVERAIGSMLRWMRVE
ncbi:hypothetical protein ACL6C3_21875 [Capilliphycus salinus ALCB114379]|uniref:nSTAND1 domain-containing NTPase n=1 Tax=Capilliphycus salinus TaxID=2768948 RepID=UPI0039A72D55